jgi:hypothetical protein
MEERARVGGSREKAAGEEWRGGRREFDIMKL